MKTTITKEELQKSNTQLKMELDLTKANNVKIKEGFEMSDKNRRTEFAKAFGWKKKNSYGSMNEDWYLPTWEEIFIEQGKLLASRTFKNYMDDVQDLHNRVIQLEMKPENQGT